MQIEFEQKEAYSLVKLDGKLDSVTSTDAEAKLKEIFGLDNKKIIINFENLDYISSAGLRVLLILEKKAKTSNIKMVFCGFKSKVLDVFLVSGFDKLFHIEETVSEAENSF